MEKLAVRDLMTDAPETVSIHDTLADVYDLMINRHFRHVPVLGTEGELVGLVSHRDLAEKVLSYADELPYSEARDFLESTKVSVAMTFNPEVIDPDASITEAVNLILENKFGCLPVVDGVDLVGILTEADFVRYVGHIAEDTEANTTQVG